MLGIYERGTAMRTRLVLLAVGLLVVAPSLAFAATPVSPAPGGVVTSSNPTFSWSEPVGLTTDYLRIASEDQSPLPCWKHSLQTTSFCMQN